MKEVRSIIRRLVLEQTLEDMEEESPGLKVVDINVLKRDTSSQKLEISVEETTRKFILSGPLKNITIEKGPGTFGSINMGTFPMEMIKGDLTLSDIMSAGYKFYSSSVSELEPPDNDDDDEDVGSGLKDANIVNVSDDSGWNTHVVDSTGFVMVDIWADWCGPCKTIAPDLATASAKTGIKLVKIDVSKKGAWQPQVDKDLYSGSLPTVILFKDGTPLGSASGVGPIRAKLKQAERMMKESRSHKISVTSKQLREIIRDEILREIVRKRDCTDSKGKKGKWVLLTKKKPHKKLGCHTSKKGAIDQERAIKASGG